MGEVHGSERIFYIALLSLLLSLTSLLAWGCGKAKTVEPGEQEEAEEEVKGEGPTTLTLYFRYNTEDRQYLSPEKRTVEASDPYRAAMEELIKGPSPDSGLYPVLPDTVKVLDIKVRDSLCTVNVSKEILTDASQVGVSAEGEGLALSAIADTLTGFEEVARVKLLIEGMQSGKVDGRLVEDFWGHVGLPEYLERNEDVVFEKPEAGESMSFSTNPQTIGTPAEGLKIIAVRYADHGSYYRFVFEVAGLDGSPATACPVTTAEWLPMAGGIKVTINGIGATEVPPFPGESKNIGEPLVQSLDGLLVEGAQSASYMVALNREAGFYLHYVTGPVRIILDLNKT